MIGSLRTDTTTQNQAIARDIGGLRQEIRNDRHATAQQFHHIEDRITKES